jgi:hypothetical protein
MQGILICQRKKYENSHLEIDFSVVNFEDIFPQKLRVYWHKTCKIFASFPLYTWRIQYIYCIYGLGWIMDPFNKAPDIISIGMFWKNLWTFVNYYKVSNFWIIARKTWTYIRKDQFFLRNAFNSLDASLVKNM